MGASLDGPRRLASLLAVGSGRDPRPVVDLWASVPFDDLPSALVRAAARSDWNLVRDELRSVMTGRYGRAYGRELSSRHTSTPIRPGSCQKPPPFVSITGLRPLTTPRFESDEATELIGVRDVILAPTGRNTLRGLPNTNGFFSKLRVRSTTVRSTTLGHRIWPSIQA